MHFISFSFIIFELGIYFSEIFHLLSMFTQAQAQAFYCLLLVFRFIDICFYLTNIQNI